MAKCALIVDDVEFNRKLAAGMLKVLGWNALEAGDGAEALEILKKEHSVELLLLDISMPVMDGEEACAILRADRQYDALPIIAYTAHALEEDCDRFINNGFDGLLIKPIELQALTATIQRAQERRGQLQSS